MADLIAGDLAARRVTLLGGLVNLVLIAVKASGGLLYGSIALLADALHSLTDLISDVVVYVAVKFGSAEADENHPYGHRRFETIASLAVGLLVIATGVGLILETARRLQSQEWLTPDSPAIGIAVFAIVTKEALYHITVRIADRHARPILKANAVHHRTDSLSSVAVLFGLGAAMAGISSGDLLAALVVGLLFLHGGWGILAEALLELSEAAVDESTHARMLDTILATGGVEDVHVLKTKTVGGLIFAEAHVQVHPHISVTQGHEIAHRAMHRVLKAVPRMEDITIHIDPEDDDDAPVHLPDSFRLEQEIRTVWAEATDDAPLLDVTLHLLGVGVTAVMCCAAAIPDTTVHLGRTAVAAIEAVDAVEIRSPR
jgi:cation diffusion facilitator family transporter